MGEPAEPAPDVVIFFDANMPKMDACSANCQTKELVLCRHKFDFNACLVTAGHDIYGLSDFHVVRYFLNLIRAGDWNKDGRSPLFIIMTKDRNFIQDVKLDYFDELEDNTADIILSFAGRGLISCDGCTIRVVTVSHKPYGASKKQDLHNAIESMNRIWSKVKTS